jgi:hypothetical protein
MWCIHIPFKREHLGRVRKVLADTAEAARSKGESFDYAIEELGIGGYDYVAKVFVTESKDRAHKVAMWLVKKALADLNLRYWVRPWRR